MVPTMPKREINCLALSEILLYNAWPRSSRRDRTSEGGPMLSCPLTSLTPSAAETGAAVKSRSWDFYDLDTPVTLRPAGHGTTKSINSGPATACGIRLVLSFMELSATRVEVQPGRKHVATLNHCRPRETLSNRFEGAYLAGLSDLGNYAVDRHQRLGK